MPTTTWYTTTRHNLTKIKPKNLYYLNNLKKETAKQLVSSIKTKLKSEIICGKSLLTTGDFHIIK